MPFFSIIVSVYGIEDYINECVQSILDQSFSDYELILVDDGGKDNCPRICDEWAEKDNHIRVLHKKNGGLSSARNAGLKSAEGEYVIFIDGDDLLCDNSAFETIWQKTKEYKYDIVSYNRCYLVGNAIEDAKDYRTAADSLSNFESFIKNMIKTDTFYGSAWVLCSKKSFLLENELLFTEGRTTEDFDWLMRIVDCRPSICNLPNIFYSYRTGREGSITYTVTRKKHEDYLFFIKKFSYFDYSSESLRSIMLNYVAYQFVVFCANAQRIENKEDRMYFRKQEKPLRFLIKYDLMKQTKMVRIASCFLGYRLTDILLGIKAKGMQ